LGEEEPEGAADGEDAFAAVRAVIGLGEEVGREDAGEEELEFGESGLTDLAKTGGEGSQAMTPLGEKGSFHRAVVLPPY